MSLLHNIALTMLPGIGTILAQNLVAYCGSSEAVFKTPKSKLVKIPGIGEEKAKQIVSDKTALLKAEKELKFITEKKVVPLFFSDENYPHRLRLCADMPLLLYYKGNADLNTPKILAVVGTRNITEYGKEQVRKLINDLAAYDVLVVSGLAYGVDIHAHQNAIENKLKTVGVLGHGFHTLYPPAHRSMSAKMIEQGGLLTEYTSQDDFSPHNFPKRNRIIAGMSDALLLIESAPDGGGVLTARIANSYNREVFAIPGRITDKFSAGCNLLIQTNQAILCNKAADLLTALNWGNEKSTKKEVTRELFLKLNEAEQKIYDQLKQQEEIEIDMLIMKTGLSNTVTAATLLEMEMNNILVSLPGKRYKLVT